MAKAKLNSEYVRLAKKTNALGLTNYDLTKPLNQGHKSQLTKLSGPHSLFHDVIKSPKNFQILPAPKSFLKKAKQAGSVVSKTSLFVRNKYYKGKKTFKNMRIEDNALKFDETLGNVTLKKTVIYPGTEEFFKLSRKLEKGEYKLGPKTQVTFKIGGNSPFNRTFSNYSDLYAYVADMQNGKVLRNIKNGKPVYNVDFGKILPEISFVEVKRNVRRKK